MVKEREKKSDLTKVGLNVRNVCSILIHFLNREENDIILLNFNIKV